MHIILGATGHVGSALTKSLLARAEPVMIVTHDETKAADWVNAGAEAAIVDIHDCESLRQVFNRGHKLFLLNPPAAPSLDMVKEEEQTLECILNALRGSTIEKVVGESTYGAQAGEGLGDFNTLFQMEQELKTLGLPNSIIRAAPYMSNWDLSFDTAIREGVIRTFYPIDLKIPMVAPCDLGALACELMTEATDSTRLVYAEGPSRYSASDVAKAFSHALGKTVLAVETSRDNWADALKELGYCEKAAESMIAMTNLTRQRGSRIQADSLKGQTTLQHYVNDLVQTGAATKERSPRIASVLEAL